MRVSGLQECGSRRNFFFPHINPVDTGRNDLGSHIDGGSKAVNNATLLGAEQWICRLRASITA